MKPHLRALLCSVALLALPVSPACAQLEKLQNRTPQGMHHKIITSAETEKELMDRRKSQERGEDPGKDPAQPENSSRDETEESQTPTEKSEKTQEKQDIKKKSEAAPPALTPVKDLKPWKTMASLFAAQGHPKQADSALAAFNDEPGRASPTALFMIARLYDERGDLKLASRYYYAAQLRARFDYFRWPGKGAGTENPYMGLSQISQELGGKIGAWALASSDRLAAVLDDVKTWDEATPYAYEPGYKIPDGAVSEDKWPDLLTKTRGQFFTDSYQIVTALKAMKK